jgi:hypothetical protein
MLGFLSKGFEYNKLANSLNQIIITANELQNHYDNNFNSEILIEPLISLALKYKIEVFDSLEKNKWDLAGTIFINSLGNKTRLDYALSESIKRITIISEWCKIGDEVENIMFGGELFYKLNNLKR